MFTVAQQIALLLTRRVIVCVCVCALVRLCVGERDTERLRDRERGKEDGQAVSSLSWWQTEETDGGFHGGAGAHLVSSVRSEQKMTRSLTKVPLPSQTFRLHLSCNLIPQSLRERETSGSSHTYS